MINGVRFSKAQASDQGAIGDLLRKSKLPHEDIHPHITSFVVARNRGELVGCVGLEVVGDTALLRSLAVESAFRGQGIGEALCREIIESARRQGITELYLLTTDQSQFFEKRGFRKRSRESAPGAIQLTTQFQELCPASAILMSKNL